MSVTALCDECGHFVPWPEPEHAVPGNYNPCARKHRMALKLPLGPTDQNWGFYRPGCNDRMRPPVPILPTPLSAAQAGPPRTPDWHRATPSKGTPNV